MLDLFLKLVEKLVDLAKESQRIRRALHDDFVSPVMQQYEIVHKEYISSFQVYRQLSTSNAPDFKNDNPVFSKLESDMIFSHASMKKLMAMSKGLSPFQEKYNWFNEDKIRRFIWSMLEYVQSISDSARDRYSNAPRGNILDSLNRIAAGDRFHEGMSPAQEAEREVLEKMWEMQDLYSHIQSTYQAVRAELLK